MTKTITTVGFIGLGNIGKSMAMNLLKGDFSVWVFDAFLTATKEAVERGAIQAANIAQMAEHCDVIGICVRDDADVVKVMDELLAATSNKCKVVAVHSTVSPQTIKAQAKRALEKNIHLLDAPISGGASGAANATLCYMVGGDADALALCRPMFATSAKKVIHAGELGMGMMAKLCNNLVTYAEFTAIYEALRLAKASGLDVNILKEVGAANGNITDQMQQFLALHELKPHMTEQGFLQQADSFAAVAEKDLTVALQQANLLGEVLPGCESSLQQIAKVYKDAY
jgi:3-hydroxyisobutyrate dehydrogenase